MQDVPAAIGPYPVTALLGEGAVARVYAGTDPRDGRPVAIKVLREGHSPEHRTLERFLVEIDTVRRLRHRNIIDVFDFGALPDGRPYFVMEHQPGQTLQQRIDREGPLTFLEAAPIFVQACDALHAAHAAGVVHRDLKPDNIYLCEAATGHSPPLVKLLDFGIAKLSAQKSSAGLTQAGATVGTPLYMSPEQIRALPLDARSDVYTLGVALFQCLTGEVPFYADSHAQTATMHLNKPPPRPSERSDLPLPPLADEIVLRCMAKEPDDRYASVDELREVLAGGVRDLMSARQLSGSRPLPSYAGLGFDSAERSGAPFLDSAERGGAPFLDSAQRGGAPFLDSAERGGAPFLDSAERGGAPHLDSAQPGGAVFADGAQAGAPSMRSPLPSIPPLPGSVRTPYPVSGEHARVSLPSIPPLPGGPTAVHFGAPTPLGASAPSSGDYRVPLPSIPPLPGGGRGVHFGPVLVSGEHQRVSIPSVPPLPPGSRVSLTSPTGEHLPVVIGESPQRGTPFLHSPHRGTPFIDENATGKVPVQSSVSLGSAPPRGRPGWLSVVVLVVAALLVGWLGWLLAGTTVDR